MTEQKALEQNLSVGHTVEMWKIGKTFSLEADC